MMVEKHKEMGKSYNVSISLYESQINKIKNHVKKSNKFRTEASFFQHIVDEYFKKQQQSGVRTFLSYCGYPIIITAIMLYVAMSTIKLNQILVEQSFYFNDLYIQQNIYFIIGFLWLSITAASMWTYISKKKSE